MKEKDINQQAAQKADPIKENKAVEISPEALEERLLLSGLLVQRTEELAREVARRKKKREEEEFELLSGKKISIRQIQAFVTAHRRPYSPKFPNDVPFFTEMYRLLKWTDKDPHNYIKPPIVGTYIHEIIYDRFDRDVLPALQVLAMPDGIRIAKFFQFLNEEGQKLLLQFRKEAIEMMEACTTWYEFRTKYGAKYGLTVQKRFFEE